MGLVWLLISLAFDGNPTLALVLGTSVCATFAVVAVVWGISGVLKRRKASADANRAVTITLTVVLSVVVAAMMPLMILGMGRENRALRQDQLPLALSELLGVDGDGSRSINRSQSPLLGRIEVWQSLRLLPGKGPANWMHYTVVEVKAPFLYDLCLDRVLSQWEDYGFHYEPVNPAPWGAEAA